MGVLPELFGEPLECHDGHADTLLVGDDQDAGDTPSPDVPSQHSRMASVLRRLRESGRTELAREVAEAFARRYAKEDAQHHLHDEGSGRFVSKGQGDHPPAPRSGKLSGKSPPVTEKKDSPVHPREGEGTTKPASPFGAGKQSREKLSSTPVRNSAALTGGCNVSKLLELEDGTHGVFKPAKGERAKLRNGVDAGTYWRREVASSEVADLLGFGDLVPTTVARKIVTSPAKAAGSSPEWGDLDTVDSPEAFEEGSMQSYVGGAREAADMDSKERYDGAHDAARAAAFDYLIGHLDRHAGNWLVKDDKLVLIDNGLSFPHSTHKTDFFNMRFWGNAAKERLPLPDMGELKGKWPEVEAILQKNGLERAAIFQTKKRFDALTSGQYETIEKLPSLWHAGRTLGQDTRELGK